MGNESSVKPIYNKHVNICSDAKIMLLHKTEDTFKIFSTILHKIAPFPATWHHHVYTFKLFSYFKSRQITQIRSKHVRYLNDLIVVSINVKK